MAGTPLRFDTFAERRVVVRSESLAPTATPDPPDARTPVKVHEYLTALPGLLAEADLSVAHVEARDRRTGALVAYSFVTINRALALHVAEAVRVGVARLDIEASRGEADQEARGASEAAVGAAAPKSSDDRPGQYL
jgi:hypothetical protein